MTKLAVDILETEMVNNNGAINKKLKEGGSKSDGWLIQILHHDDGQSYGYVADKVTGEITAYPIYQLRIL